MSEGQKKVRQSEYLGSNSHQEEELWHGSEVAEDDGMQKVAEPGRVG